MSPQMKQLKIDAKRMGISHSPNIGYDALKKKIEDARNIAVEGDKEDTPTETTPSVKESPYDAAMKLVRIEVRPNKQEHSDYQGEIFTAISKTTGKITKFVPFHTEWHVPQILLDVISSRRHVMISTQRGKDGKETYAASVVPTYHIQRLPDITPEELEEIRINQESQAMAEGRNHFEGERIF